jgi:hypothetical protein
LFIEKRVAPTGQKYIRFEKRERSLAFSEGWIGYHGLLSVTIGYYELPKFTVGYLKVTGRLPKSDHAVTGAGSSAFKAKE